MGELQGRVALVTGASRGIGEATARALAAAGARVIVTDLSDTGELAAELGGLARRQDVTDEAEWTQTIAFARAEAGVDAVGPGERDDRAPLTHRPADQDRRRVRREAQLGREEAHELAAHPNDPLIGGTVHACRERLPRGAAASEREGQVVVGGGHRFVPSNVKRARLAASQPWRPTGGRPGRGRWS